MMLAARIHVGPDALVRAGEQRSPGFVGAKSQNRAGPCPAGRVRAPAPTWAVVAPAVLAGNEPIREGIDMSVRAGILVALLSLLLAPSLLSAQEKTLAATPPMGWNSWNKFGCHVSEDLIRQMACAMVKSGMEAAG